MPRTPLLLSLVAGLIVGVGFGYALSQGISPGHRMPDGTMMQGQMPMSPGHTTAMQHLPTSQQPGASSAQPPSTVAFLAANEKMHRDMSITFTGDADRDFAASMIPHHEGAIAMARIQLAHGRDAEMRRLAEAVIREQEREITELRTFLAHTPPR